MRLNFCRTIYRSPFYSFYHLLTIFVSVVIISSSVSDTELKPGITNLTSEDGAFEGAVIDHGLEIDFKLDSPLVCVYDGKNIHIEGLARLYEPGTSIKSDKILKFTYDGPIKEGLFIDLWSNPVFKILKE